ncbi:MAG: malto-oligosyltrehalose synthase, partial [Spirochaetota bacterium]
HGYDVVDHGEVNPELGGRRGLEELVAEAHEHALGWIQDTVPNHMAYSPENPLLVDLFENGEHSRFRGFFDVDWETPYESMAGRLIAPFLGDLYGKVLDRGELTLEYGEAGFGIRYYEKRFPLRMETYRDVLTRRLSDLETKLGREHPDALKLLGALYTLESLPNEDDPSARADKVAFTKRMLWELYRGSGEVRAYLTRTVDEFNGTPGEPDSYTALNELHWKQVYRLAYWKVASEEINYRRFFSINDLICLRVEDEEVFEHSHRLLFELVEAGLVDGLRIDHIDGLYEPGEYLRRLRERVGSRPIYVEKILQPGEELPSHWPVDGTTGYDTLNLVNGLFVDAGNAKRVRSFYRSLTGVREEFESALVERKRLILSEQMAGDLDSLARYLRRVVGDDRYGIDITEPSLKRALAEVMVHLPVYRTYVTDRINRSRDVEYVKTALARARTRLPYHDYELDYIETFLLLSYDDLLAEETRRRWGDVVLRFQQFTGPLMAKGLEDTLMYAYVPLASVNEVGGSPEILGYGAREFHEAMRRLAESYPRSMTASSTHDTKRGEDTRLRINAIAAHIDDWSTAVRAWRTHNRGLRRRVAGAVAPDANDEYLVYQTLLGVLPPHGRVDDELRSRVREYLLKALREAKRHTDWTSPNEPYERATLAFLSGVLDRIAAAVETVTPAAAEGFGRSFLAFVSTIESDWTSSVLAHQVVRLTAPGVPDVYRGSEGIDQWLVDPDNRRPVDWSGLAAVLERVEPWLASRRELLEDGAADRLVDAAGFDLATRKLAVIRLALTARRRFPDLFVGGAYTPLSVSGVAPDGAIAFARSADGERAMITVALRRGGASSAGMRLQLPYELASGDYIDLLSGARLAVTDSGVDLDALFARWPAALLWRAPSSPRQA